MNSRITLPPLTLVLGGARSGKSRYAEALLESCGDAKTYLATAEAGDPEMAERIRQHRERRGDGWTTIEEPLDLGAALEDAASDGRAVLVDCLTLWLANILGTGRNVKQETAALLRALPELGGPVVFVSNEVGQGIVPQSALGRSYRDHAGRFNQAMAEAAQSVVLVVAGLPLVLKPALNTVLEVQ